MQISLSDSVAAVDDGETLSNFAVTVAVALDLGEDLIALNELTKHGLAAIEHVRLTESNHEFTTVAGGASRRRCQHASLVVAEGKISINFPVASGAIVLLIKSTGGDSKTGSTLLEVGADERLTLKSLLEAFSEFWVLVLIKFEDHIANLVSIVGHRQEHSWVTGTAVGVKAAKSTSD